VADYAPFNGGDLGDVLTYTAGAAITGGQLLMFSAADTVIPTSGVTQAIAGVAAHDAASGSPVSVFTGGGVVHETLTTALSAPPAPVPTFITTTGTVLAGVYSVIVAYVNALGESVGSAVGTVTTTGGTSVITVPSPPANAAATGWYCYCSGAGNTTYSRQGGSQTIGTPLLISAPPTTGGATPSAVNTSGPAAGALLQAAAGGLLTGGATAGQEVGVAIRGTGAVPGLLRWKSTKG
jgi:hypothetical protein